MCLSGCDSGPTFSTECPVRLAETESDFFPASVGKNWAYQYDHRINSDVDFSGSAETQGVVNWHVEARDCIKGTDTFTITETFEGITRHIKRTGTVTFDTLRVDTTWTRTLTVTKQRHRLRIDKYTADLPALQWRWPVAASDTVSVDTLLFAGFGTTDTRALTLVRNVGVLRWGGGYAGRSTNFETLTLMEASPPALSSP